MPEAVQPEINVRNEELFYKIAAAIEERPMAWNQNAWVAYLNPETGESRSEVRVEQLDEWCETSYCIAGWAMHLTSDKPLEFLQNDGWGEEETIDIDWKGDIFDKARNLLGLSDEEAHLLFLGGFHQSDRLMPRHPETVAEVADALRAIGRGETLLKALPSWW